MKKIISTLVLILFGSLNLFSQQEIVTMPNKNFPVIINNSPVINSTSSSDFTRYYKSDDGTFTALIEPNIRLFPTNNFQSDPHISVWSANSNFMVVSSVTGPPLPNFMHVGYIYTTNSGSNWYGNDSIPAGTGDRGVMSVVCYNQPGTVFYNYIVQNSTNYYLYTDRSTNYGANWIGRVQNPTPVLMDAQEMAIDINPSSPYFGRIYVVLPVWAAPFKIALSYSTNNGISFLPYQIIGAPISGHYELTPHLAVDNNGNVYCTWGDAMSNSPNTEHSIGFSKSTNGGENWTTPVRVLTINGAKGNYFSTNIRGFTHPTLAIDKSGGPRNHWLYITWAQKQLSPAGNDPDICFSRSSNGGLNWSVPNKVNNDSLNNGRIQLFPSITVDNITGKIGISFFDNRDVASPSDSVHSYIAVSDDGGDTWQNIRVSNVPHRPEAPAGWNGWYTIHTAIYMNNNIIRVFWPDKRDGNVQIYTSSISITGIKKISEELPQDFKLYQNYPNPFNSVTSIKLKVTSTGDRSQETEVRLTVFDLLGREVATLVNEKLRPGTYEVRFDAGNLPSGIYFYRLQSGDFTDTKRMILIK